MYKIKNYYNFLFVFMILFLSGCSTSEVIGNNEKQSTSLITVPENKVENTEGTTQEYKILTGVEKDFLKSFHSESVFEASSKPKKIVSEGDIRWESEDGSNLLCQNGYVYYTTKEYEIYESILSDSYGQMYEDFNEFSESAVLTDYSPDEAISRMETIIKTNEIPAANPRAYALTKEALVKLSRLFMSDEEYAIYLKDETNEPMKREFGGADEAYLVRMEVLADSYALTEYDHGMGDNWFIGSDVWAIIKKDKVIAFSANAIYDINGTSGSIDKILSMEHAEKLFKEKFENDIIKTNIECTSIKQKYAPITRESYRYTFMPIYIFTYEYDIIETKPGYEGQIFHNQERVFLDAEEGTWIE